MAFFCARVTPGALRADTMHARTLTREGNGVEELGRIEQKCVDRHRGICISRNLSHSGTLTRTGLLVTLGARRARHKAPHVKRDPPRAWPDDTQPHRLELGAHLQIA